MLRNFLKVFSSVLVINLFLLLLAPSPTVALEEFEIQDSRCSESGLSDNGDDVSDGNTEPDDMVGSKQVESTLWNNDEIASEPDPNLTAEADEFVRSLNANGVEESESCVIEEGAREVESRAPADGAPADGLVSEGGETYLYEGGARATGERYIDGHWRYFDPEEGGAMARSRFALLRNAGVNLDAPGSLRGCKWCYYDSEGRMLYGQQCIDGGWYHLDPASGAVTYGFVFLKDSTSPAGKWVYYGPVMGDGRMRYGEQYIDGGWYYLDANTGAVTYGFVYLADKSAEGGHKWVYYGPHMGDGRMRYGEQYIDGGWYYLTPGNGAVETSGCTTGPTWATAGCGTGSKRLMVNGTF